MSDSDVEPGDGFAGTISPKLAYAWVEQGDAVIVDVRSEAEWAWVGFVPGSFMISLRKWPSMTYNEQFEAELKAQVPPKAKLLFLCRSGARSEEAAIRAASLGFEAYNIRGGFEGDLDSDRRRGNLNGWQFDGLPWLQG